MGLFQQTQLPRILTWLVLLTLANTERHPTHSTTQIPQDCSTFGCLYLPRDVAFDTDTRRSLQTIRRLQESQINLHDSYKSEQLHESHQQLKSSGNANLVTLTMVGFKGGKINDQINQDRSFVLSPYQWRQRNVSDTNSSPKEEYSQLLGVMDGHGRLGEVVSQYVLNELHQRLATKLQKSLPSEEEASEEWVADPPRLAVTKALTQTFVELDRSIPTKGVGGCTASIILQIRNTLYIANAGDSVSMVAVYIPKYNFVSVVYTSREDKPHLPEERRRIEEAGGIVSIPANWEHDSSRVVAVDPKTGYQVGLAMSRSIGDWDINGVTAEPLVDVLDLNELVANVTNTLASGNQEGFCNETMDTALAGQACVADDSSTLPRILAISATDGMMDYLTPSELANAFAKAFYDNKGVTHPFTTAEDLILRAAEGWNQELDNYRDDIAIAAAKIPFVPYPKTTAIK